MRIMHMCFYIAFHPWVFECFTKGKSLCYYDVTVEWLGTLRSFLTANNPLARNATLYQNIHNQPKTV